MRIRHCIKHCIAAILPDSFAFRYFAALPQFATWLKKNQQGQPVFANREELYEYLSEKVIGDIPINYFEMGVWYGNSMKKWNGLNKCGDSRFYGFDTFQGLPEEWIGLTNSAQKGTFTSGGIGSVRINDARVKLIEGLFQDTVPDFIRTWKSNSFLNVLHVDCDLYSSTLYSLASFNNLLRQGDIIIFDEFSSMDEFRALNDYSVAFRRNYKLIACAGDYYQTVAIMLCN
jgi:hypothetical protein